MEHSSTRSIPMEELAQLIRLQTERGGRAVLTVVGSSMMPMLYQYRDSVVLEKVTRPLKKGDIILYQRENSRYVLHRIIRREKTHYICCGDNQYMREKVLPAQVLAVVTGFYRMGRERSLSAVTYRLYTFVWVYLFFLRIPYLKLRRCLARLRKQFRKK